MDGLQAEETPWAPFVTEASGRMVAWLPDFEPEVFGIHAIYLSRQHQPLALRLLVDFLAARFAGDRAPWDLALQI